MKQRPQRAIKSWDASLSNQRKGSLYNQYLNKSCYFQTRTGVFINPKSEETFIQETMFYFNLESFQQTQIVVILLCIFKIIPWFHLADLANFQDIALISSLMVASLIGFSLKKLKRVHIQRFIIMMVICLELMIIQFLLLDKDLVDLQLWQMLGQIGIIIQNTLSLATPIQSGLLIMTENSILKLMMLCRGREQNSSCNQAAKVYESHCQLSNIYNISMNDFTGIQNNLITVYPVLTIIMSYLINRMMRKYWIFINSFQKSDKCNAHLSQKQMTTFFIIDQHMQFVYYTEKAQQFIHNYQSSHSPPITNFSQLFKSTQSHTLMSKDKLLIDKVAIFQQKVQEVLQYDKEIELEVWLEEQNGQGVNTNTSNLTEESTYCQGDTVGMTLSENHNKALYKLKLGPITWRNSKMIQIILEKQTKVSDMIQINEYFYDLLFKNSADNISQLEKDYLKWYNMVSLNVIKNDDLKELSKCINEYHQQYIYLYMMRKINNEFHQIQSTNNNEFNIKANIIQAVEIVLVKKMHLVNQIKVLFERSFPSGEVIADDILFHHMMVSILDLIIQPVEEKPKEKDKLLDSSNFKNSIAMQSDGIQQRQVAEPVYKKFDYNIDCKLKTIINSKIFVLQFLFEFNCPPETEKLLQKVFKKVRNMDAKDFIDPSDLLNQGKDFVNLFLIFLQLKRQNGEFELEKKGYNDIIQNDFHRDSTDETNLNEGEPLNNSNMNIYILSIYLSVQTVQMQTLTGQYSDSMQKARGNMGTTVTQNMNQRNIQKNSIRCPAPLNLSFARDQKINMSKFSFVWEYRDVKELKKSSFDKALKKKPTMNAKIFSNQQQSTRISKIPTNKEIDQSQQPQSLSSHNIPPGSQQILNSQVVGGCGGGVYPKQIQGTGITNASSGSNLSVQGSNSAEMTQQNISLFGSASQAQQPGLQHSQISGLNQQTSIYQRDSLRKGSQIVCDIQNLQKFNLGNGSPQNLQQSQAAHTKNRRKTSIIGFPSSKLFSEESLQNQPTSVNKIRSLSRQASHQIKEEVNTSEEEEKKDMFLSDQKQPNSSQQYKFPNSQRKIAENPYISMSGQKSNSANACSSSQSSTHKIAQSVQIQCPSEFGLNSRQQSAEKLVNVHKQSYDKPDSVKQQFKDVQSEKIIRTFDSQLDTENSEIIEIVQKQIQDTLKLYKHLFIQDTSLVVKQIITHSKAFDGLENKEKEIRNSPYLFHTQSVNNSSTTGGEDSDNSQSNTQQRRKVMRANSKIKRNTTILEKLSGVNTSGNTLRRQFRMKPQLMKQQFNDSPQMDSCYNHGDSGAPSRLSREFDSNIGGTPSQTQGMSSSLMQLKDYGRHISQQDTTSNLNGIDTDCIQSADEESRNDGTYYEAIDRKRASTYDIPYFYFNVSHIDQIQSSLYTKEVNHSRKITHKRQWLTDDVWRKQVIQLFLLSFLTFSFLTLKIKSCQRENFI